MNNNLKFNYQGTRIANLVRVNSFFSGTVGRMISLLFWLTGAGSLVIWISFIFNSLNFDKFFGYDQILLAVFLVFLAVRSFLRYFVHSPQILSPKEALEALKAGAPVNVFDSFSVPLTRALLSIGGDLSEVNSLDVLKALVKSKESNFILNRIGISGLKLITELERTKAISASRFSNIVERALEVAVAEKHQQIEIGDMLVVLSEADPYFSAYLSKINVTSEDLANIVYWQTAVIAKIEKKHDYFNPNNLHLTGGIGKDWAYGYTPDLNSYSVNISEGIERQGLGLELIGHDKEISMVEEALNRTVGANAILVGEPGVGKKTTVLGFAKKVNEGNTLPNLAHKKVVELNVDLLISGLSTSGQLTERLTQIFSQAANAGNVVLFIDGIEKILSSGEAGQVDATSVLIPYLSYPEISFIGTTNISDYNNLIGDNPALMQRLEKVEIAEPSDEEMIRILEDVAPSIEYHYGILVTYSAIKEIVRLAKKYILDQPNPEKSIALLEGAANSLNKGEAKVITVSVIDDYVSSKTNIPVKEAVGREREILVTLDQELKKRVIGQDQAVRAVAGALQRSRAGVTDSQKPIGSFLFVGPTGVGKTETAKALAEVYFGSKDSMIRFDMSEYQNKADVYRLIGAPTGSGEKQEGELTSQVRNKPFSLLLFDEIEKANPDILNLLLAVLDEGFVTSSTGKKVYYKNTIIIATSNAGANIIRQLTAKNTPYDQAQKTVVDYVQDQGIFRPEFLNRFSAVVYYAPLNQTQITEVAKIMIRKLAADIRSGKGIILRIENSALTKLAALGFDPEMGARPMARVIQEQLENFLANKILRGEVAKGQEIVFHETDIK